MPNTLNFNSSIYASALNKPNSYKYVYNLANRYNVWSTIIDAWNQKSIEADDGVYNTTDNKYEFAYKDTDWVVESITSVAQSGANLVVNYSGTNDFFRNKITVADDNWVQGRVISHSAGQVVLEPASQVALVAASHFTSGMYIREFSSSAGFRNSTGLESLYAIPIKDYDYAQRFRETCYMADTDFSSTYPEWEGKSWGHAQVDEALIRFAVAKERQWILGAGRGVVQSSIDGTNYYSTSLKWACQNRGGQYVPQTSPISFDQFNNILYNQSIKWAGYNKEDIILLGGKGFMFNFQQRYVNNFIQQSGVRNTFGGEEVKGLSVMRYSIGNEHYNLVNLPLFDDPNYSNVPTTIAGLTGSRLSNSYFIINPNMIPTKGGGSPDRAPIQKIYWGQKGMNAKIITGMNGLDGQMDTGGNKQGMFQNTNNSTAGMQVEVMEICGQHIPSGKGITFVEAVV